MYSLRDNGDSIAHEFTKLMGNGQTLEKVAEDQTGIVNNIEDSAEDHVENNVEDNAEDHTTDAMLHDMIVDDDSADDQEDSASDLESSIDDMVNYAEGQDDLRVASTASDENSIELLNDSSGQYIMNGLGKIAASLRSKGEGFAADVVEVTAFGIREDLVKEARRKGGLISVLNKMASDFRNKGDSFAADMVVATVNKISN